VYYYDPARHELRRLRSGDHRYWVTTGPATTVLVQTSVFWRLAAKYGEMFYRLACLETGIQAAQALVVGGDLGARARLCFRDADVTGLLGLDPRAEGVHSVIELREPAPAAYDGPSLAAFPQAVGVHLAVVEESRRHPEPLPAPAPGTGRRIVLPPAEPDMLSGLRTRHATLRGFSGEPMSVTDLSAVLAAYGQQPRWDLPAHLVEFYCLVNDVTDVPAGAYRYLPDQHQLELVREEDPRPRLRKAGLAALPQQGARTANFWLMPVGDAEPAERRYGNRWYRVQHAAAGAALHRACLAAAGIGVASRIQNDVLIHQLDEWLGLAGRRRGLLVAQLGWEHRGGLRPEFRLNW
jgi:SagB-type dehydrogenase family enzyme